MYNLKRKYNLQSAGVAILFVFLFIYGTIGIATQVSAGVGITGAKTVTSGSVIVNEFTALTADAAAGVSSITVASATLNANSRFGAGNNLTGGELVMIIQMQGASVNTTDTNSSSWGAITNYNNAGNFEFDQVISAAGTTINLVSPLLHSYTATGKVQVIRVPRYTTLSVSSGATITTDAWNGSTGGVVTIEVNGTTTMNGTISTSGLGFRGGTLKQLSICCPQGGTYGALYASKYNYYGGEKGESIAGDTTNYIALGGRYGRGAIANGGGGGNDHNTGGGGGSNGDNGVAYTGFGNPDTSTSAWIAAWDIDGAITHTSVSSGGGKGGYSYSNSNASPYIVPPGNAGWDQDFRNNVGGHGGRPLNNSYNSGNLIFMGGGGGSGDSNDGDGSGGGNGGGIIYLLAGNTISGSGTLNANGAYADSSLGPDGCGGGGGGGSVIVYTTGLSATGLNVTATGGIGGYQYYPHKTSQEAEGPGGGGGGGYISLTSPNSFTTSTTGSKNGLTNSNKLVSEFPPNGATMGATGLVIPSPTNPYSGTIPLPITLVNFSGVEKNNVVLLSWVTASEENNDYFTLQRSSDGRSYSFLGRIAGEGNSNATGNYQYEDDSPLTNGNYYLLSQTDFDGKTTTFYPVYVNNKMQFGDNYIVNAGPIPFGDEIKIDYYVKSGGAVEINLINITGQVVKSETVISDIGINSLTLQNLSDLSGGIYFLRITGPDATLSLKVIKN